MFFAPRALSSAGPLCAGAPRVRWGRTQGGAGMGRQRRRDTVGAVLIVVGLLIGGLVFASPPVRAGTTSAVTTTDDPVGGGTASNCDLMSVSPCSLRDAVAAANATTDATISLPAGTYTVTHLAPGTLLRAGFARNCRRCAPRHRSRGHRQRRARPALAARQRQHPRGGTQPAPCRNRRTFNGRLTHHRGD